MQYCASRRSRQGNGACPITVTNLSCSDSEGNPCPGGSWSDDFTLFYAQSDATCKDSSTSPNYTYPSPVAYVYNDDEWYASVQTTMTSMTNGAGGGIDLVDAKVSAIVDY